MRKTNWFIIGPLLLAILCLALSCAASIQLFSNGCLWWECAPERSFDVLDLRLPPDLFPTNAIYQPVYLNDDDDPETLQSSVQTIYWGHGSGLAIYTVDTYASNRASLKSYEHTKRSFFSESTDFVSPVPWSTPTEVTYRSPLADDLFISCGMVLKKDDYRCGVVARYQEFVLFFNATISEKMSYQDFRKIVVYMDEQMSNYLYKKEFNP